MHVKLIRLIRLLSRGLIERNVLTRALLLLDILATIMHMITEYLHDLVQGHIFVKSFRHFRYGSQWYQILTPQVLSKFLKALNPPIVREYLLDFAMFEVLHPYLPRVILNMIIVKARASVLGPLELAHPLRKILS